MSRASARTLVWFAVCALALAWGYRDLPDSWFLRDDFMWLFDSRIQLEEPMRFLTTRPSGYFRPFANFVFGMEYAVFGLDPRGFLVINILIHGWSAWWLARLVRLFGGSVAMAGASALAAIALTAAAPGVVWISGLVSLLGVAMVLPALYFYRRFQVGQGDHGNRWGDFVAALVFTVLAVCSRESGVLAGVGILILEGLGVWEARRAGPVAVGRWLGGFALRMLPFALAGVGYLVAQWDFVAGGAGARGEPGTPLDYVRNVVTTVPAMLRPEEWRRGFSLGLGLALVGGWLAVLTALRGARGLRLGVWLVVLLHLAFLPTYLLLSNDYVMANRYRYEAVFVIALMVGALVEALGGWRTAADAPRPARQACALVPLAALMLWHLAALPRFVREDARFAQYAASTRAFANELEAHFGAELVGAQAFDLFGRTGETHRVALVGVPVENPRHLRDQLAVWYDFPSEWVTEVHFDLNDAGTSMALRQRQAGYVKEVSGVDEVWVWMPNDTLRRGAPVTAAMNKNWRMPNRPASFSKVQVLEFPLP